MGEWVAKHEEEGAQVRHGSRASQAQTGPGELAIVMINRSEMGVIESIERKGAL